MSVGALHNFANCVEGMNYTEFKKCSCCGSDSGPIYSFFARYPDLYLDIPENERSDRVIVGTDNFIIDDYRFVLGTVDIPIIGTNNHLCWGIWCSVSLNSYERIEAMWNDPNRESCKPYFGWVSNELLPYSSTTNLRALVYFRPLGFKFRIQIEPTEHQLALDQNTGITQDRMLKLVAKVASQDAS
jgi:hypothetical protein